MISWGVSFAARARHGGSALIMQMTADEVIE
jgi:hypothetical protein